MEIAGRWQGGGRVVAGFPRFQPPLPGAVLVEPCRAMPDTTPVQAWSPFGGAVLPLWRTLKDCWILPDSVLVGGCGPLIMSLSLGYR